MATGTLLISAGILSTNTCFMHAEMTSLYRQDAYKFMPRCGFYFQGYNIVKKELRDSHLHKNQLLIMNSSHDSENCKASVYDIPPQPSASRDNVSLGIDNFRLRAQHHATTYAKYRVCSQRPCWRSNTIKRYSFGK